jgi:cytochrome c-type biogenesis protein
MIGNVGPWGNYAIAAVFLVFDLVLLDIIPLPWSAPSDIKIKSKGIIGAFLLGLIFGIALGPCTFAFMAPILGLTFKMGQAKILWGFALIGAYAAGHCGMIVIAGTSTNFVQTILNYNEKSHIASIFKRVCGILVLAAGLYMIYKA